VKLIFVGEQGGDTPAVVTNCFNFLPSAVVLPTTGLFTTGMTLYGVVPVFSGDRGWWLGEREGGKDRKRGTPSAGDSAVDKLI
jgi:hypothetical protein